MSKTIKITLQNGTSFELKANEVSVESHHINLKEIVENYGNTIYLKKQHQHLNTVLDATLLSDSVVLYIDEEKEKLSGASYIINPGNSPFAIQTQQENCLLLPLPLSFDIQKIETIKTVK